MAIPLVEAGFPIGGRLLPLEKSRHISEIPPFPPLKKGGGGGI
jgi:hypothetical protein